MKRLLLSLFVSPLLLNAQKVIYDKKDPFTNERNIAIGNTHLSNILQSGVAAKVNDSAVVFYISFIVPAIPGVKIETADSTTKECKLKSSNNIITGKWFGSAQVPIGMKLYNSSTYIFNENDFRKIASSEITDIKVDASLYEITSRNRSAFGKLCNKLLSKL